MRKEKFTQWVPKLTYGRVVGGAALLLLASAGTAYAANEWTGANIVNNSLTSADYANDDIQSIDIKNSGVLAADLAPDSVNSLKIANASVTSQDILNATITAVDLAGDSVNSTKVVDGSLTGADVSDDSLGATDLASDSVGSAEIQTDGVQASEIADNSIDSGEIIDFTLTNQDVGVLFAQMSGVDGSIANSSGGVTGSRLSTGTYDVDFGRDISNCAFSGTAGEAGVGGATPRMVGMTDRAGNTEAIFIRVTDQDGASVDNDLQIVVVC